MRHYEILLLIHPDQSNQVTAMVERYRAIITKNGGKVHRQEDWGKQQLAYQINNKIHKAHYVLLNIECDKTALAELGNAFKFNDAVIRSLITKCAVAITEPSVFFKAKETDKSSKDGNYYHHQGSNGSGYGNKDYILKDPPELLDSTGANFTDTTI